MNAELLGIITVGIVLLGVGIAFIAQSEEIQAQILPTGEPKTIGPFTSSTRTDLPYCYPSISPECR